MSGVFEQTEDQPIEGGCRYCDAYRILVPMPDAPGVFTLTVFHDDGCVVLRSRNAEAN